VTVVVAYTSKEDCWMASDSASSNSSSTDEVITPKIFKHAGGGIIGSAGSWFVLNALASLQKKKCEVQDVLDLIRTIKEGVFAEELEPAQILMAWPGRPLVVVYWSGFYVEMKSPFYAIGIDQYALGFLEGENYIDGVTLKKAVSISAKYATGVGLPAKLLHVKKGLE